MRISRNRYGVIPLQTDPAQTAPRPRRTPIAILTATALLGMAFALVAVALLMAIGVGVVQPLILLGLLPVLVGAALMTRPAARAWYDQVGGGVA